jgi:hypothetical protein
LERSYADHKGTEEETDTCRNILGQNVPRHARTIENGVRTNNYVEGASYHVNEECSKGRIVSLRTDAITCSLGENCRHIEVDGERGAGLSETGGLQADTYRRTFLSICKKGT